VLLFSAAPLVTTACVDEGSAPVSDSDAPAELLTLRGELVQTERDQALARQDHFRPLCDEQGYPLVGNVATKVPPVGFQPSEFCEKVRE
jgi:hypothetical protein